MNRRTPPTRHANQATSFPSTRAPVLNVCAAQEMHRTSSNIQRRTPNAEVREDLAPTLNFAVSARQIHSCGMDKDRVAEILMEIGTLLELKGENPFKTRAYENAARALESLTEPLEKLIDENRLGEVEGIGEGIQKKITELVNAGKLAYYDDLKA